jgi:hypothetical protein
MTAGKALVWSLGFLLWILGLCLIGVGLSVVVWLWALPYGVSRLHPIGCECGFCRAELHLRWGLNGLTSAGKCTLGFPLAKKRRRLPL